MTQPLFPRFLEDTEEYEAAGRFWRDLLEEVAVTKGSGGEWEPSIWRVPAVFADGTSFPRYKDQGNIVFAAFNQRTGRAVQVVQWTVEDAGFMGGWTSVIENELAGEQSIVELTLSLSLTVETAEVAREMLSWWLDEAVPYQEVEHLIREISRANARTE